MLHPMQLYCCLIVGVLIIKSDNTPTLPPNTIQIPLKSTDSGLVQSQNYYTKMQQPRSYTIHGASSTFVKVPGLTIPFYHTEPLLYKIRLEGKAYSPHSRGVWMFARLMIDDYLLYVNKLVPNTADRYKYDNQCGDLDCFEYRGGFYWYATSPTWTTVVFNDIIYLTPGLHVFDVGVRGGPDYNPSIGMYPIYTHTWVLTMEVIQFDRQANIGMTPVNVSMNSSDG
ncbi:unnamed protein product [Rotaria sp. Silwood1]|nr:unnamed protein product [Rotaria sp. Silwood1]